MIPSNVKITPMLRQYMSWKERYPDCLLLFRMGDFYELFFDDAKIASEVLDITLTSRDPEKKIPMAGVPFHSIGPYLSRIVKAGHKAAICEQVSEPDGKQLVDRKVTRIVTPGTYLSDDDNDDARLASLQPVYDRKCYALSLLSVCTGTLRAGAMNEKQARDILLSFSPHEILVPSGCIPSFLDEDLPGSIVIERAKDEFKGSYGTRRLMRLWGVSSLRGFGIQDGSPEAGSASVSLQYLEETQFSRAGYVRGITPLMTRQELFLDLTTQKNLELTEGPGPSLLGTLNSCRSPMGKRTLRNWILSPLLDEGLIRERLEVVEYLVTDLDVLDKLRNLISNCADLERIVARLHLGRSNPRDIGAIRDTLRVLPDLKENLVNSVMAKWITGIHILKDLGELLDLSLEEDLPRSLHQGRLIRDGYDKYLDNWRKISENSEEWLENYLENERGSTGIPRLKAGYNKVFGYYLEVSRSFLSQVPERYSRKQTLVSSERYITPELKSFEEKKLKAEEESKARELELYTDILERVMEFSRELQETGKSISELDVLGSFARLSWERQYTRPDFDSSGDLVISGGRHPVIEVAFPEEPFVPNDIKLNRKGKRLALITGPNMAGKSTYLRTAALVAIMAQIGCFVPAEKCLLTPLDRIFTRIGARDDLARGNSTFMVEMLETANILHNVTDNSLVILDEIGRGTSTYDGMSIAWSVLEYLHDHCGCSPKVLFATHYHELIQLEEKLPKLFNLSMAVEESSTGVVFLHQVVPRPSDRSYGVEVARLAGIPERVVRRSADLLCRFEQTKDISKPAPKGDSSGQLVIFSVEKEAIMEELAALDPDNLTPFQALEILYRLREKSLSLRDGSI